MAMSSAANALTSLLTVRAAREREAEAALGEAIGARARVEAEAARLEADAAGARAELAVRRREQAQPGERAADALGRRRFWARLQADAEARDAAAADFA